MNPETYPELSDLPVEVVPEPVTLEELDAKVTAILSIMQEIQAKVNDVAVQAGPFIDKVQNSPVLKMLGIR